MCFFILCLSQFFLFRSASVFLTVPLSSAQWAVCSRLSVGLCNIFFCLLSRSYSEPLSVSDVYISINIYLYIFHIEHEMNIKRYKVILIACAHSAQAKKRTKRRERRSEKNEIEMKQPPPVLLKLFFIFYFYAETLIANCVCAAFFLPPPVVQTCKANHTEKNKPTKENCGRMGEKENFSQIYRSCYFCVCFWLPNSDRKGEQIEAQ